MRSNYPWLAIIKAQAKAKKTSSGPLSSPSLSYTGGGLDGQVDPKRPAGTDENGNVFHEGEAQVKTPESNLYLSKGVTDMAYPDLISRVGTAPKQPEQVKGFRAGGADVRYHPRQRFFDAGGVSTKGNGQVNEAASSPFSASKTKPTGMDTSGLAGQSLNPSSVAKTLASGIGEKAVADNSVTSGLAYQNQELSDNNSPTLNLGREQVAGQKMQETQNESAAAQQAAQSGASPQTGTFLNTLSRAGAEATEANTATQAGVADKQNKQGVAQSLVSQGLQVKTADQSQQQTQYQNAVAAGDYNTAAQIYGEMNPGKTLDQTQFKTDQANHNATQATSLQQLKDSVGMDQYNSIQSMINSGATLAQVNSKFPNANLTQDSYNSMFNASAAGATSYAKEQTAMSSQLAAGDLAGYAKTFAQAYPGVQGIDVSQLTTKQQQQNFSTGMSTISSYVQAGMSPTAIMSALQSSGTLSGMGITATQAGQLVNAMNVNQTDAAIAQIDAITDPSVTPDMKQSMKQEYLDNLTGASTTISSATADPFGTDADAIIAKGANAVGYSQVVNARANDVVQKGDVSQLANVGPDDPVYQAAVRQATPINTTTENGYFGDKGSVVTFQMGGKDLIGKVTEQATITGKKLTLTDGTTVGGTGKGGVGTFYQTTMQLPTGKTAIIANANSIDGANYMSVDNGETWTSIGDGSNPIPDSPG